MEFNQNLFQICLFDNYNMLHFEPNLPIKVIYLNGIGDKMLTSQLSNMKKEILQAWLNFNAPTPL